MPKVRTAITSQFDRFQIFRPESEEGSEEVLSENREPNDLETGTKLLVAEGLETNVPARGASPKTMIFNGVAVSEDRAYVSGDKINAIYTVPLN